MLQISRIFLARSAGIVGTPNVGKSTLFNSLTCSQRAETGNFPFCTINANVSKATIFDQRLEKLCTFCKSQRTVNTQLELSDVAGLIKGASTGLGLGNKFLADIRTCSILLHVVRCFESAKNGFGPAEPLEDISVVDQELALSDLAVVEKRLSKVASKVKKNDPELLFLTRLHTTLENGGMALDISTKNEREKNLIHELGLLSVKPQLLVLNVDEESMREGNDHSKTVQKNYPSRPSIVVCSAIEEQVAQFPREERLSFLCEYGVEAPAGEELLRQAHTLLGLQTFFTVGPLMAHAWSTPCGSTVRDAAGEIHSDLKNYFLSARVCPWDKYCTYANNIVAEGIGMKHVDETYAMKDGDVLIVEHSAKNK